MLVLYVLATLLGALLGIAIGGFNVFFAIIGACVAVILLFTCLAIIPSKG